ncbi:hypothetical protein D3C85_934690 [compost metagenome]
MITVPFASALPLKVGLASLVVVPLAMAPVMASTSSITDTMVGLPGGVVATVKPKASDATLALPALSTAVTVMVCTPLPKAVAGVQLQLPDASACTCASITPLSNTTTVLLASALPLKSGRASSVVPLSATLPTMLPTSSTTDAMVGLAGASVSTVKPKASDTTLVLPALSIAVAVMLCGPLLRFVSGTKVHSPAALACTRPISVAPSRMITVLSASAVPLNQGLKSSVVPPWTRSPWMLPTSSTTLAMVGLAGGVVSTTKFQLPLASLVWPSGLVEVAVMPCAPSVRLVGGVKLHLPEASATTWPSKVLPS